MKVVILVVCVAVVAAQFPPRFITRKPSRGDPPQSPPLLATGGGNGPEDQETAAQTTAVQAQRFNVHKQQIFDHQQKTSRQKQNTKLFQVPLVHSEQEADAQAKLSLLEAALTSAQPNHQQDGLLPRIFIVRRFGLDGRRRLSGAASSVQRVVRRLLRSSEIRQNCPGSSGRCCITAPRQPSPNFPYTQCSEPRSRSCETGSSTLC